MASSIAVGSILETVKKYIYSYTDDVVPVTVAVADPRKVRIGLTVQRQYPLTMIERRYGIPFGRLRSDPSRFIFDFDELHGCKWSIDVHEAVFQSDAMNEEFIRTGSREGHVVIAISTGIGNMLQNLRSVVFTDRRLHHVVGERFDQAPPYACLVEYSGAEEQGVKIGFELLLFPEGLRCQRIDKGEYMSHPATAMQKPTKDYENKIQWAVSGYPLIINGNKVPLEMTAENASDFRHVWRFPKLQRSLVRYLAELSTFDDRQKKNMEFYFGLESMNHHEYFVPATLGEAVTFPVDLPVEEVWLQTVCDVCKIDETTLKGHAIFDKAHSRLKLKPDELAEDFQDPRGSLQPDPSGYVRKGKREDVQQPGDFFIDLDRREITVLLQPAIYPHHIVGIAEDGLVVNVSIAGRSGASGITIEAAKQLCEEIGLAYALILDNGNDVIVRLGGGAIICHRGNIRQTRLTAALHFGCLLPPRAFGGAFDGFELGFATCATEWESGADAKVGEVLAKWHEEGAQATTSKPRRRRAAARKRATPP